MSGNMDVFEQRVWKGIVKKGGGREDPEASRYEINTEPGEDYLSRLSSRKPLLSTHLPQPALSFEGQGQYLVCFDQSGNNPDVDYSAAPFEACVCFKWGGLTESPLAGTAIYFFTSLAADATNWGFSLVESSGSWDIVGSFRTTGTTVSTMTGTTSIVESSWYWAELTSTTSAQSLVVYKDGSTTAQYTVNATDACPGFSAGSVLYLGGLGPGETVFDKSLFKGAIAYAACGGAGSIPDPWKIKLARDSQTNELDVSFVPYNPRHSIVFGKIGA